MESQDVHRSPCHRLKPAQSFGLEPTTAPKVEKMANAKKTATPATSYAVTLDTYHNAIRFAMYLIKTDTMTDTKLITALQSATVTDDKKDEKQLVLIPSAYYRTVKSASYGFKYKLTDKDETAEAIAKAPAKIPPMPKQTATAPKPAKASKPAEAPAVDMTQLIAQITASVIAQMTAPKPAEAPNRKASK